ncbi:MAG TPA: hypothetical protein VM286_07135, partial [Candidatus Thermoplasmatota archaeon]|nr:hypothetical protein [Candidatus Thermoplasmatota archaeon]
MLRRALLLSMAALLVLPVAAATIPLKGTIDGVGSVWLEGAAELDVKAGALLSDGGGKWVFNGTGQFEEWNLPLEYTIVRQGSANNSFMQPLEPEQRASGALRREASVSFAANAAPNLLRVLPDGDTLSFHVSPSTVSEFAPMGVPIPAKDDRQAAYEDTIGGLSLRPSHSAALLRLASRELHFEQGLHAAILGGEALVDGRVFHLGQSINRTRSLQDPVTGSGIVVMDTRVLVLRLAG